MSVCPLLEAHISGPSPYCVEDWCVAVGHVCTRVSVARGCMCVLLWPSVYMLSTGRGNRRRNFAVSLSQSERLSGAHP